MEPQIRLASDIIIGAVEGGTGYWAYVTKYDHGMAKDSTAQVRPATATLQEMDQPNTTITLTCPDVLQAMNEIAVGSDKIGTASRQIIREALVTNDAGDCDAEVCDTIVQIMMTFGELIYG